MKVITRLLFISLLKLLPLYTLANQGRSTPGKPLLNDVAIDLWKK